MPSLKSLVKSYLSKGWVTRDEFTNLVSESRAREPVLAEQLVIQEKLLQQQSISLQELGERTVSQENLLQQQSVLLQQLGERILNIENQMPRLANELQTEKEQLGMEVLSAILDSRFLLAKDSYPTRPSGVNILSDKATAESFDVYLEKFRNLHPHLYDVWASVNLGSSIEEYKTHPERSCAVDHRANARMFRGFAAPYLCGQILDIGCGTLATPNYLQDYPAEFISGIDPLEPFEPHPFEFVRGFAEFLPWKDDSFDVVVAATSLDHTLSLDLAFTEIRRVLKPGGYLLVWDWFSPDSKPYQPADQAPELIDTYHLFHFSEDWFEAMVTSHFSICEKIRLYGFYQYDRFYALKLKR